MVKKLNYTFLIAFFSLLQMQAQDVKYGVLAGGNYVTLSDGVLKELRIQDGDFTYHVGGVLEYELSKTISLRPKLVLSRQGDLDETNFDPSRISSRQLDYSLTYINIPLQLKFFSKPYIVAGPQVGILVGTGKGEADFGDLDNSFDYGLNVGIGYDVNDFFIELSFYQGFQTLITLPNGSIPIGGTDVLTNSVFQLSIGYFFN